MIHNDDGTVTITMPTEHAAVLAGGTAALMAKAVAKPGFQTDIADTLIDMFVEVLRLMPADEKDRLIATVEAVV